MIGDQQHAEEGHRAGEQQAIGKDDEADLLEVLELRRFHLAIDLRERFLAAHGEDRVAKGDDDAESADQTEPTAGRARLLSFGRECLAERLRDAGEFVEEAERVFLLARDRIHLRLIADAFGRDLILFRQVRPPRRHRIDRAVDRQRGDAPDKHDRGHHRGGDHDLERLAARFVNAEQILPQEVDRHGNRDRHRAPVLESFARVEIDLHAEDARERFECQADDVLPRRDTADRAREHVVEQQRRDGRLGREPAERFFHDPIDAAANEQRAAFDVDRPHAVAEQQDAQNKPGRRLTDLAFDDST